jgi:hypothetical protein
VGHGSLPIPRRKVCLEEANARVDLRDSRRVKDTGISEPLLGGGHPRPAGVFREGLRRNSSTPLGSSHRGRTPFQLGSFQLSSCQLSSARASACDATVQPCHPGELEAPCETRDTHQGVEESLGNHPFMLDAKDPRPASRCLCLLPSLLHRTAHCCQGARVRVVRGSNFLSSRASVVQLRKGEEAASGTACRRRGSARHPSGTKFFPSGAVRPYGRKMGAISQK